MYKNKFMLGLATGILLSVVLTLFKLMLPLILILAATAAVYFYTFPKKIKFKPQNILVNAIKRLFY